jgi:hypothetical protein
MQKRRLLVDGHVHIYDCYHLEKFFDYAVKNMDYYYKTLYPNPGGEKDNMPYERILLLTEGKRNDFFSLFKTGGGFPAGSAYRCQPTGEDHSLLLTRNGKPQCYLLKGRQIVTKENLEVLLIASGREIEDGLPIGEVINGILENNDMAVLAWGFGKWFFSRGKIVTVALRTFDSPGFFIGDNSGRPASWPEPIQFKEAKTRGVPTINGSDPLPFSDEITKVGTYGFAVEGEFNNDQPAGSLWKILLSPETTIGLFGRRDGLLSFVKRQAKIYVKKYSGKG